MTQSTQTIQPLDHARNRRRWDVDTPFAPTVTAAPGYTIFLTGMWNGRDQELVVDPENVDALVAALTEARDLANSPMSPVLPAKSKEKE